MKKNVASQAIGAQMTATDGSDFTSTVTVSITGDNGTQTLGAVGAGVCTHKGNGYHSYTPSQSETNFDHIAFTFEGTGAVTATMQVYTNFPQSADAGAGSSPSAIADAVWDENLASHAIAGSTGEALAAAGSAGDPWITPLPGAYGAGTAGEIIGNLLAEIDSAITAYGALRPTVAGRTLDVTVDGTAGVNWANVENQAAVVDLENTTISEDQVIATVTGNVNGSVGSVLTGGSLDPGDLLDIADAVLKRDMGAVVGAADRSLLQAIRLLRNKWAVVAGTLTVTMEDDSTTAWTGVTTGSAGADPITSVDPV